jgi:hypothetical protein
MSPLKLVVIGFVLTVLSLYLGSCNVLDSEPKGVISGILLDTCGGNPVADASIEYWKNPEDADDLFAQHFSEELLVSTTTDSLGKFSFEVFDIPEDASIRVKKKNASTYLASGFIWPTDGEDLELNSLYMYGYNFPVKISIRNKEDFKPADKVVIKYPTGYEVATDSVPVIVGSKEIQHSVPVNFYALVYNKDYDLADRMFVGRFKVEWHLESGEESTWSYVYETECSTGDTATTTVQYW